jgi:chloramphenicol 3-O-phosphotransferase
VATTGERFDYLYRPAELQQWVPAIQAAADRGVPVHVLMNNNRSNYAVVNGFDMAHLLGVRAPRPPESILRRMEERDGDLPAWVREAAEPPAPPALEGSRQRAPNPVVAQSEQLHLDV